MFQVNILVFRMGHLKLYHCYDQMGVPKVRKVIFCRDRQELQRSAKDCPIARQILVFWERLESLFRMFGAFGSHLKG